MSPNQDLFFEAFATKTVCKRFFMFYRLCISKKKKNTLRLGTMKKEKKVNFDTKTAPLFLTQP